MGTLTLFTLANHNGVAVDAQTRALRSFEEHTVRAVFEEIFEAMWIPPKIANYIQLRYQGSMW
ncbi:hypothetical protein [Haloquadratum walsbyi]|jgi:hypothetical protein|uniref:Uncharacterized protein n=1 Tax=Haloquadratum walsbyi J07HQW2 TaxID=1238425 RepID=U1PQL9_9EURY|nr:hypothetical protein [Haloquadratum walsbyi]ERG96062.1 MAG: hypothetical protein J07HQW2_02529 [Haloquadratum walsbyi J07HQW2]